MRHVYATAGTFCLMASTAWAADLPGPLVSTDWLAEHQEEVLIIDVRNDDASFLESGHIIGAIPLDSPMKRLKPGSRPHQGPR
ncbi:rhodanese-like domain-containing protein [uncultured Paracoccus sp.]|uniref:rhodanese-like domain-containing protein n=1 Tax=uncultured Paracoccus sp. TaxID=189685 RepID=UPI002637F6A5|nr:rhodanese-like domain-containing protein [uncultured Paracoccus sp.]